MSISLNTSASNAFFLLAFSYFVPLNKSGALKFQKLYSGVSFIIQFNVSLYS
nr:MAG TPA: hypothetical protein [Bacteriophage sp.]